MQIAPAQSGFGSDFRVVTAALVSRRFMRLSVLFAMLGMGMGIFMGVSEDFTLRPVHVHVNLLGWVSCALYALVYRAVPGMAEDRLAWWHFVSAAAGLLAMTVSFPLHLYGYAGMDALLSASFLASTAGMALFAVLVFKHF